MMLVSIYADDLEPGQEFRFGSYTVTEDQIVEYARQWDPVFIHADPEAAAAGPWGAVVASGLHTMAIYQRLAVQALWWQFTGGIGRSFMVRFHAPVHPETTLTGQTVIDTVTPRPERGDAQVVVTSGLTDEDGTLVVQITADAILPLRPTKDLRRPSLRGRRDPAPVTAQPDPAQ